MHAHTHTGHCWFYLSLLWIHVTLNRSWPSSGLVWLNLHLEGIWEYMYGQPNSKIQCLLAVTTNTTVYGGWRRKWERTISDRSREIDWTEIMLFCLSLWCCFTSRKHIPIPDLITFNHVAHPTWPLCPCLYQNSIFFSPFSSRSVLSSTTCCNYRNVLYMHCMIRKPVATHAYWTLEIWLVQLKNWIFNFILANWN